ncbi:MAG TPA: CvpA family protein [Patescibacteria group bacterium]|nr:CvpA family protein [Patescibacteria group bacterium]
MTTLDIILAVLLVLAFFSGLKKGLIRSLGRMVGLIIGAYVASHYYLNLYEWGNNFVNISESVLKVISFIVLFIIVTQIVHFLFYLIEKAFNLIAIVPGSKYINNILGGALGLFEGSLFLGLIFYVISRYPIFGDSFSEMIKQSIIIPWLNFAVDLILPVLPQALKALQSLI